MQDMETNTRKPMSIELDNESSTVEVGRQLGTSLRGGEIIYLEGQLGAGKTTLCRGILAAFGHSGAVKSPTYTLVEPYEFSDLTVYHFDLYRLGDPEELEFMGIRDYFQSTSVCLVEWPAKGGGILPEPDVVVSLNVNPPGRRLDIQAGTKKGEEVLSLLQALLKT